jgi:hypothetical protein
MSASTMEVWLFDKPGTENLEFKIDGQSATTGGDARLEPVRGRRSLDIVRLRDRTAAVI